MIDEIWIPGPVNALRPQLLTVTLAGQAVYRCATGAAAVLCEKLLERTKNKYKRPCLKLPSFYFLQT